MITKRTVAERSRKAPIAAAQELQSGWPDADDAAPVPQAPTARRDLVDEVWLLFASTKLAIALILAIVAACLAGALIMQAPSEMLGNPEALRTWIERVRPRFGFWTDVFASLGLFWVFQAVWFRALLGLLTISTLVCTSNRLPAIWKQVFRPNVRPRDALFERGRPRESALLPGDSSDGGLPTVRRALRRCGYRVEAQVEPGGVYLYADRFRLARFGTLLTHSALILVLLGAVLQGPLGFFEESGFAVPIGSTREVGHQTGLAITVEDFADEYHPNGSPKDYRSDVVLYEQGREVARQTVRVNEPLAYNGVRFHQAYYGQAAMISVTDRDGKTLFRDAVALTYVANDGKRPLGYFFLPSQRLHVYLVGTIGQGDPLLSPGELLVEAYRGQVGAPTYRETITQRRQATLGDVQFLFERELPFTGLRVVRDPGAPIIWIACTLLVLGLCVTFYLSHRRLWVRIRPEPKGIGVTIVGAGQEMAAEARRVAGQLVVRGPTVSGAGAKSREASGSLAAAGSVAQQARSG